MQTLRERTQRQVWLEIHDAAAELTLEDGPQSTTIESIAKRAGISKRTFFNYYSSKEDAILGMSEPRLTEDATERFRSGKESRVHRLSLLVIAARRSALGDRATMERRRKIVRTHPALRDRLLATLRDADSLVVDFLVEELGGGRRAEAEVLVAVANSIVLQAHRRDRSTLEAGNESYVADAVAMHRDVLGSQL